MQHSEGMHWKLDWDNNLIKKKLKRGFVCITPEDIIQSNYKITILKTNLKKQQKKLSYSLL